MIVRHGEGPPVKPGARVCFSSLSHSLSLSLAGSLGRGCLYKIDTVRYVNPVRCASSDESILYIRQLYIYKYINIICERRWIRPRRGSVGGGC